MPRQIRTHSPLQPPATKTSGKRIVRARQPDSRNLLYKPCMPTLLYAFSCQPHRAELTVTLAALSIFSSRSTQPTTHDHRLPTQKKSQIGGYSHTTDSNLLRKVAPPINVIGHYSRYFRSRRAIHLAWLVQPFPSHDLEKIFYLFA